MRAETMMPMSRGWRSVPQLTSWPRLIMRREIGGPTSRPALPPAHTDRVGVTRMSRLVRPATRRPASTAAQAAMKAPSGSPGPLRTRAGAPPSDCRAVPDSRAAARAPTCPATMAPTTTKVGALRRWATPTPMPAPVREVAIAPRRVSQVPAAPGRSLPSWPRIVPRMREANRPWAMPVMASMRTRWARARSAGRRWRSREAAEVVAVLAALVAGVRLVVTGLPWSRRGGRGPWVSRHLAAYPSDAVSVMTHGWDACHGGRGGLGRGGVRCGKRAGHYRRKPSSPIRASTASRAASSSASMVWVCQPLVNSDRAVDRGRRARKWARSSGLRMSRSTVICP